MCNDKIYYAGVSLPHNFNYAGVISMAGAVCSDGAPQWQMTPCPILLFHGDADCVVPFEKATLGDFGLWGSKSISTALRQKEIPHAFHRFNGASHEIAITPCTEYCGEIYDLYEPYATARSIKSKKPYRPYQASTATKPTSPSSTISNPTYETSCISSNVSPARSAIVPLGTMYCRCALS